MSNDANMEIFIFSKLEIPQRSEFYHLKPIGVGTPYVESLGSYASRLAQQHFVPLSVLINHGIHSLPTFQNKFSYYSRAMLGSGIVASNMVRALEVLTMRRDLVWTTMVTWVNVIPYSSLTRAKRAWCSVCYETWRKKGEPIYDPLLWTLDAVMICPLHSILLTSSCPNCKAQLFHVPSRSHPGFCTSCKGWLGNSQAALNSNLPLEIREDAEQQLWMAKATGELLASAPNIKPPSRFQVARSLKYCVDKYGWGSCSRFASQFDISPERFSKWLSGRRTPILKSTLELTYRMGMPPLNFFCGNMEREDSSAIEEGKGWSIHKTTNGMPLSHDEVQKILTEGASSDRREPLATFARITGWDKGKLKKLFQDICAIITIRHDNAHCKRIDKAKALPVLQASLKEIPPPSRLAVAERIGCSSDSLKYNFPGISRNLITNYKNYRCGARWENVEKHLKEVLSQDPPITLSKTSRLIGIPIGSLYRRFPVLTSAIVRRFEEYTRTQKKERTRQLRHEVQEVVDSFKAEGIYPSVSLVATRVKASKHLNTIRLILREVKWQDINNFDGKR